nr:sensor histidine kinase [Romboutsia sp. 13368]
MIFDNFGNLWIGTNIGLSKFDIKSNKFTSYTTAQGLTNNFINSILLDDDNNLWISTNKGLNKFDIEKENITAFTKTDGIYGYQFNVNSSFKDKNGVMIFGSTNGITYFNPKDIKNPAVNENKVVLGDIYIGKNKVIYDNKELILEHYDKDLSITYFLPVYESLNNITYEYMIEGLDSNWIYLDSKSYLNIKTLDSGKYTLKIRARDGHGNLTKETSMNIKVKKPLWKTPLAYLIYLIVFSAIAFYILNYVKILQNLVNQKTMNLNKQLEENKRLSEEIINNEKFKNDYFVNLSHELRTPINVISSILQLTNSMISNKTMTYERAKYYTKILSRNCENLLKIINDIIDSSKIETGNYKINKKNNDIVYIVEEVVLSMSNFIEEKGLSLIIDPEIEEKVISCDETEIERCMINLIGNAVKFTPEGGEIKVYIKEIEDNIEITIEDTGIGISKEDQDFIFKRFSQVENTGAIKASSSGIGLTLVKHIVELHGGYIKLESELNKGSKFTIGLPDICEEIISEST